MKTIYVVFNNGSRYNWQLHKDCDLHIMECRYLQFKKADGEYAVINLDRIEHYETIETLEIKDEI